jgi:plastocyanin
LALVGIAWCAGAAGGAVTVSLVRTKGEPIAAAIVTIRALSTSRPPAAPVEVAMDQVDLRFEPRLLVIPVGSRVTFPNSDTVSHQVYSFSPTKKFQLPLYRGKPYAPIVFDSPGVVTVGCNIHDAMVGHIVVTDALLVAKTSVNGQVSFADLPAGEYELSVWEARMRDPNKPITQRFALAATPTPVQIVVRSAARLEPNNRLAKRAGWDDY